MLSKEQEDALLYKDVASLTDEEIALRAEIDVRKCYEGESEEVRRKYMVGDEQMLKEYLMQRRQGAQARAEVVETVGTMWHPED